MDSWSDRAWSPEVDDLPVPRHRAAERLRTALDAVQQAVAAPVSLDRIRRVVMHYGRMAREQAMQLEETLATLRRALRDVTDTLPLARRAEVLAFVQWWAVHGYHRAD